MICIGFRFEELGLTWSASQTKTFSNSVQIKLEAMALSYINSLALVLCVHLSLLSVLLTCGTVCRLLLILGPSAHLRDRFNV